MRNILIVLFLTVFWSCTSCNNSQNHDSEDEQDLHDYDLIVNADSEVIDKDSEVVSDLESDPETDDDNSGNPDGTNEGESSEYDKPWLIDNDPYADKDNFLYEYYGDYDVIPDDPEKVRDLWRYRFFPVPGGEVSDTCENGWQQPFEACSDYYPFQPVIIENDPYLDERDQTSIKNSSITDNKCDGFLTPEIRWNHHWVYGRDPNYISKNGKVVFTMSSSYALYGSAGTYVMDILKRQIIKIATPYSDMAFNGSMVFMTIYNDSKNYDNPELPGYEMPVQEVVYYDIEKKQYGYAWYGEKFYGANYVGLSDTYAMISYQTLPDDFGEMKVVYAKIGDWKNWKELKKFTTGESGYVIARFPHMVGSQMVFQNYEVATIFCDLEKGDDGCVKVSLENERTYFPKIIGDRKMIYSAVATDGSKANEIVQVELNKDGTIKSRESIIQDAKINGIMDVDENFIMYGKKMGETENGHPITMFCYYRMSDKKSFCIDGEDDMKIRKDYSYLSGGGRYLVYQHYFDIILRDMECYCDHNPERCPYSDYTPNVQNPKVSEWKK